MRLPSFSVLPVLTFENLCMNMNLKMNFFQQKALAKSKIKEFWPHSFTTCRTALYYTHIVLLNEVHVAHVSSSF